MAWSDSIRTIFYVLLSLYFVTQLYETAGEYGLAGAGIAIVSVVVVIYLWGQRK
jgi:hypothetical protein